MAKRRKGRKGRKKASTARKNNRIPLPILKRRLAKLERIVKSRS